MVLLAAASASILSKCALRAARSLAFYIDRFLFLRSNSRLADSGSMRDRGRDASSPSWTRGLPDPSTGIDASASTSARTADTTLLSSGTASASSPTKTPPSTRFLLKAWSLAQASSAASTPPASTTYEPDDTTELPEAIYVLAVVAGPAAAAALDDSTTGHAWCYCWLSRRAATESSVLLAVLEMMEPVPGDGLESSGGAATALASDELMPPISTPYYPTELPGYSETKVAAAGTESATCSDESLRP